MLGLFRRDRLSRGGKRQLAIALARAEERVVETHVAGVFDLIRVVGEELPLRRILDVYVEALELDERREDLVTQRVLSRLEAPAPEDTPRSRRRR